MLAFRLIKSVTLRKIFDDLCINRQGQPLQHMSRTTMTKMATYLMKEQKNDLMKIIADAEFICATADIWSAPNRSFKGVTAHWINNVTYKRKSAV
ncbi:hypothetical protein TKK_0016693 [Trichogramma kaykai]